MKLLLKFFIALYIFLSGGYGQLRAATAYENCLCSSKIYNLDGTIHSALTVSLQDTDCLTYKSALSQKDKANDKIDNSDNEENEDEQISVKKLSPTNKYFTTVFGSKAQGYSYHDIKKSTPSRSFFTNFISQRWYIIFRVIRI